MVSIHTNPAGMKIRQNLTKATGQIGQAIERLSTGYRINQAKDNAAGFHVANDILGKLNSYLIAEENITMGIDIVNTASDNFSLAEQRITRLREIVIQISNGTYSQDSIDTMTIEAEQIINELERIRTKTEYAGENVFEGDGDPVPVTVTKNVGLATTSSTDIEVPEVHFARMSDKLGTFMTFDADKEVEIIDKTGTTIATRTFNENNTIGHLLEFFRNNGVSADMVDGVISLNSSDGKYGNDVSTNGVLEQLGIGFVAGPSETVTIGTSTTSSAKVMYETIVNATTSTQLEDVISMSGNETINIKNVLGVQASEDFGGTNTIGDVLTFLNNNGMSADITDGVITISSTQDLWAVDAVAGGILDKLGITTNYSNTSVTTGTSATSSDALTYQDIGQAVATSKLGEVTGLSGSKNVVVKNHYGDLIVTQAFTADNTLGELMTFLGSYSITATLTNGVISLTSAVGNFVTDENATGYISSLGIGVDSAIGSKTVGTAQSSSNAITIGELRTILGSDSIGSVTGLSGNILFTVKNKTTNAQIAATSIAATSSINDLITQLGSHSVTMTLSDGKLNIDSGSTGYIVSGDLATALGINAGSTTSTKTIGAAAKSSSKITYTTYSTNYSYTTISTSANQCKTTPVSNTYNVFSPEYDVVTCYETIITTYSCYEIYWNGSSWQRASLGGNYKIDSLRGTLKLGSYNGSGVDIGQYWYKEYNGYAVSVEVSYTEIWHRGYSDPSVEEQDFSYDYEYEISKFQKCVDTITSESTITATTSTNLKSIGVSSTQTIIVNKSGTMTTLTFATSASISTITSKLGSVGITASLSNGTFSISSSSNAYISSMNSGLQTALKLNGNYSTTTNITTYSNTTSGTALSINTAQTITGATSLSAIGISSNQAFTVNQSGTGKTYTVSGSSTVNDVINKLGSAGLTATISNGTFSISASDSSYITGMDSGLMTALKLSGSFTTVTTATTYTNSNTGVTHSATVTKTAATTDTLSVLGINSNQTITVYNNGTQRTITVTGSTTMAQIVSAVQGAGVTSSFADGKFDFDGAGFSYILGIDSALQTALKLNGTYYNVQTLQEGANNASAQNTETLTLAITTTDTLDKLGINSNQEIVTYKNKVPQTVTINGASNVQEFINAMNNAGIATSLNNEIFTLAGGHNGYIETIPALLVTALKLGSTPYYTTTVYTYNSNDNSDEQTQIIPRPAKLNDKLADVGLTNPQEITINNNGNEHTFTVDTNNTLSELIFKIGQYGVQSSLNAGKLNIESSKFSYIKSVGTDLSGVLKLTTPLNEERDIIEIHPSPKIVKIQAGIYGEETSKITFNSTFSLVGLDNVLTWGLKHPDTLIQIDVIRSNIVKKQTELGATANRLESALKSTTIAQETLSSSLSTIRDTDISEESTNYMSATIIQSACATLMATANQTPSIALALI